VPTTEAQPTHRISGDGTAPWRALSRVKQIVSITGRTARISGPKLPDASAAVPSIVCCWAPLNPAGHFNPSVFTRLAAGAELALPNLGLETVHHVHADDVAQAFERALADWSAAVGESFHVVSPAALTLRGYAEAVAPWFGQKARLRFLAWPEWCTTVPEAEANATWDHTAHSPNCSIAKAERLLEYRPRYSSLQAVYEAVQWLMDDGQVRVPER
jgi:nucleoside-diphosphate-sugar epimerase